MGGMSLVGTKESVRIDVYVLEAVGRVCCAVGGIIRPIYGGVDHEGVFGFQGVDICVIVNSL